MLTAEFEQPLKLPRHIAIIMDGNGRWAKRRHLPRAVGHQRGADAVRRAVEGCRELGVSYLTLYAFSSENWKRPPSEVGDLMSLLRVYLRKELADLHKNNIRLRFIGNRGPLAGDIIDLINQAEGTTKSNTGMTLVIALNYGSQSEIVEATKEIARAVRDGRMDVEDVDEESFSRYLQTAAIPDPDLIIRTSGEKRLSNFLLWQSAYSELVFLDIFWPDFTKDSLIEAIQEFTNRDRRYGARNT
ncbi:MAG TPA: isoprenyl transferase [Alphaproteobacteria bacterium]|nr:isoprenyl transferase [Alphaproteobacteria bacterium]